MDLIKELVSKLELKTGPVLFTVLATLIYIYFVPQSPYVATAIFAITAYIVLLYTPKAIAFVRKEKGKKRIKASKMAELSERKQALNELIFNFFLSMSEQKLSILADIIQMHSVGNNKYKRVIPATSHLRAMIQSRDFVIPLYGRQDLVLVRFFESFDSMASLVIDIDPYFYDLIENYIKTGVRSEI